MKSKSLRLLLAALFTVATVALVFLSGAVQTVTRAFTQVSALQLFVACLLFGGMRLIQTVSLITACHAVRQPLRWRAAHDLTALKGFYNLGFSGAGLIAQAAHAASTKALTIRDLASATVLQSVALVSALGLLSAGFAATTIDAPEGLWIALAALLAFILPWSVIPAMKSEAVPRLLPPKLRQRLELGSGRAREIDLPGMSLLLLVQILLVSARVGRVVCIALFLDAMIPVPTVVTVTLIADLASVVPLTPGGLGIREFVIGLGANFTGYFDILFTAAVVDRAVTILGNVGHGGWVLTRMRRGGPPASA